MLPGYLKLLSVLLHTVYWVDESNEFRENQLVSRDWIGETTEVAVVGIAEQYYQVQVVKISLSLAPQ